MRPHAARRGPRTRGFTLLETLVVLILLTLAAALAAPALRSPAPETPAGLAGLIPQAREAAARRGEMVRLRIAASGEWRLTGAAAPDDRPIAQGRVDPFAGLPLTLVMSPLGNCGFDGRSTEAAATIPLDPMSCEVLGP